MPEIKPTALITGATGAIGSVLVGQLLEHGYEVRALVRSAQGRLPEAVKIFKGEITDCHALREAAAGTDVIFHLAAKLHINNPAPALKADYRRINVDGTRCLVEAAQAAGVRRLVFFSTINVYGPSRPRQVLNEDSPLRPDSWYAETKIEGEQIALAGVPAVVLRLAAVYGPGMKGNYVRLLNALRRRRFAMIGDGRNRRTLVHMNDACAAALAAARHRGAAGRIYNVTDGRIHTLREIIEAMSSALSRRPPRFHLPVWPVRLAAGLIEDGLNLVGKRSPVGRATVDKFIEDIAVAGTLIENELGYRPRYDLAAGWRETVSLETYPSRRWTSDDIHLRTEAVPKSQL